MAVSVFGNHAVGTHHAARRRAVSLTAVVLAACLAGCVRRDGINAACEWPGEIPAALDLGNAGHRQHLVDDVHFAEELGVRHADSFRGRETVLDRGRRLEECTDRLMGLLTRLHSITPEDVARARESREWRWDVVTVFGPMLLLFAVASGVVVDRVRRRFPTGEKAASVAALIALSLVVAGIGVAVGQMWSWVVEILRVGDSHLSYRAYRMPWVRHRLLIFVTGIIVFWVVTWLAYRGEAGDATRDGARPTA